MQVIYSKELCLDESRLSPHVEYIYGFDEYNNFNIRFSISDDGNIINSHQDNYIDIFVKFDKDYDFAMAAGGIFDAIFTVIFDCSVYCIEDLRISLVHNGEIYELNRQAFCHKYYRFEDDMNFKPSVEIMNIAIKEYELLKSNHADTRIDDLDNAAKLN
jgi:hypothetical protein